jgi:hypothetical protein
MKTDALARKSKSISPKISLWGIAFIETKKCIRTFVPFGRYRLRPLPEIYLS